jgi:hypothetical protein
VIGDAPTTVAARQLQFLRWVKGSIQLWWAQFYDPPKRMVIGGLLFRSGNKRILSIQLSFVVSNELPQQ